MNKVLVKQGDGRVPSRAHETDAGFDLYVSRPAVIEPNQFMDIHTDVQIAMPDGVWARIEGRSSTLRKRGLLVNTGIIDTGYTGELFAGVWNLTDEPVKVEVGERLAQLIFCPMVIPELVMATQLPETDRGTSGFGSSGQ